MSRTLIDIFIQRLTAIIRGPARLREDIADEIADHLASRIEEEKAHAGSNADAATIEAEALRAFGDPQQIARELRNIHLGDWIMFQKVMIAALVVIVIGMAASAYFSWSAARQQTEKLDNMNQQLTALVELQETAPERALAAAEREARAKRQQEAAKVALRHKTLQAKVYFYLGDKSKPAVDYPVTILKDMSSPSTEKTDEHGSIRLPRGIHNIQGTIIASEGTHVGGQATWSRVVRVFENEDLSQEVNVSPQTQYEIELDLSSVSWNPDVSRRLSVTFSSTEGEQQRYAPNTYYYDRMWKSQTCTFNWPQTTRVGPVTAMFPGKATATVNVFPEARDIRWNENVSAEERERWLNEPVITIQREVEIPESRGIVLLNLEPPPERRVTGVVFQGSRDKPLANCTMSIKENRLGGTFVTDYIKTNGQGEFLLLEPSPAPGPLPASGTPPRRTARPRIQDERLLSFPWHTPDDREVQFTWPLRLLQSYDLTNDGTLYEVDLSKVGTVRLVLEGLEELRQAGLSPAGPLRVREVSYHRGNGYTPVSALDRDIDLHESGSVDLPMPEGGTKKHKMTLRFTLSQPKPEAPDLVGETTRTRHFEFEIQGGRITETPVPLNELDKWQLVETNWRRVESPTTQPQTTPSGGV